MEKSIIAILSEKEKYVSLGNIDEQKILEAEHSLNIRFSEDYRQYLLTAGVASVYGHEFTGITKSAHLNVVDVTKREREYNPQISNNLYVVEETGNDGEVIWQSESGEVYRSYPNGKIEQISDSLYKYFEDL